MLGKQKKKNPFPTGSCSYISHSEHSSQAKTQHLVISKVMQGTRRQPISEDPHECKHHGLPWGQLECPWCNLLEERYSLADQNKVISQPSCFCLHFSLQTRKITVGHEEAAADLLTGAWWSGKGCCHSLLYHTAWCSIFCHRAGVIAKSWLWIKAPNAGCIAGVISFTHHFLKAAMGRIDPSRFEPRQMSGEKKKYPSSAASLTGYGLKSTFSHNTPPLITTCIKIMKLRLYIDLYK